MALTADSRDGWIALVERENEREVLDFALASSRNGQGRVVLIYGQSGVGRSSVLRAATLDAEAEGDVVLEACGSELERGYGFGVVRQLLEARIVGSSSSTRKSVLGHAGPAAASALGISPGVRASSSAFDEIEGVYRLVARAARDAPLVFAVDDLQWCDRLSLDFLCFLGHRVSQLPVTILAAWRRGEPGVRAGRLQALAGMPQTFFLTPAPLSADGVRAVLRRETGIDAGDEAVDAVHAQTGGQPFLVTELVAGLRLRSVPLGAGCRDAIASVTPESVRRNVVARLARHPETVQRFARAVAVLGEASLMHAAVLADVDRERARAATDVLVRAGVFRDDSTVAYAQPIVRRAVYDTLSSIQRAELHQQAAAVLSHAGSASDPAAVERAARHLLDSEPAGDPRLGEVLRAAGRHAAEEGALADAQRFHVRALAEIEEATARAGTLVDLAELELRSGDLEAGVAHASEALTLASTPSQRAQASLVYAQTAAATANWRTAVEVLETEALALRGVDPELELHLRAAAGILRACARAPSAEQDDELMAFAGLPGDTSAERTTLAACASQIVLTGTGTAERVADVCGRALARGTTAARGVVAGAQYLACHAAVLADAGDLVETVLARRASEQSGDAATDDSAVSDLALRSQLAFSRGELADADGAARTGLGALERLSPSVLRRRIRADLLATLVLVEVERGHIEEAGRALSRFCERDGDLGPAAKALRIAVALARGDPPVEADTKAEEEPIGVVAPGSCLRPWVALAHHALGEQSHALALAAEHLEFARGWGGPSVLGRALVVRAGVGSRAERLGFLEEAVTLLEDSPARLQLAHATVALGAALRRAGRRRESRVQLVRGADIAQRCGADALAARARAELVLTGARPRRAAFSGVSSLTAAELRVALLAAAGMTTRQIATELTVSPKTVSGQLGAVYFKLDVHDRVALAAAMNDRPELEQERVAVH